MRASLISTAIAVALGVVSLNATAADSSTTKAKHHHRHSVTQVAPSSPSVGPNLQAELAMRDREIAELKNALANVEAKVGELEQRTDAQSDVNIQTAKTVETLQTSATKTDKLEKIVNDTTVGGRLFIDISNIDQKTTNRVTGATARSAADGYGLDVKRGYISVTHNFNDVWSGNITTDFNYIAADGETQLFIKKAYLQGKFADAFVFHAGAYDMPWIPYVESFEGYRYVDKLMVDRLGFGSTADWGLNASGKIADGKLDYSASAVNGGGFKNATRSKGMDVEGRIGFAPIQHTVIAIGGYSGDLDQNVETPAGPVTDTGLHTASRADALIAYANNNNRFGAEYFQANDWKQVTTVAKDKVDGYSLWGSVGIGPVWSIFGRYDDVKLSKDLDPSLKDKYYNLGVQWDIRKGIKVAAVYKNEDKRDNAADQKTQEVGIFGEVSF